VAIDGDKLTLLRPGMIAIGAPQQISAEQGMAHPAPGMHHRHYSPRTPLIIVNSPAELPNADGGYLWHTQPAEAKQSIQLPCDPVQYAARIYAALHDLDAAKLPWIAVEALPESREWDALRDRISRAKA
jgi:L-threonylcarbamoyladenylate synthase